MAISHLVMTIGVGISQKKNIKNFDHVQILWNDPYILYIIMLPFKFTSTIKSTSKLSIININVLIINIQFMILS